MTVKFVLQYPKKEKSTIRVIVAYGAFKMVNGRKVYAPVRYTLPWFVPTALWDKVDYSVKKNKHFEDTELVNQAIAKIKSHLKEYEVRSQLDNISISEEGIVNALQEVVRPPKKIETPIYFSDVFTRLIDESENGSRVRADGKRISNGTIRRYRLSLWHFENYEEKFGDVRLSDLNKGIGASIQKYFNQENLAHNTKVNHIRAYITVYNYAVEKGWMEATDFHKIRIDDIEADTIALSEEEVNAIFDLKLAAEPQLELVRDTFIIGIWTLMRYGDYSSMKDYNIQGQLLKVNTTKTDAQVIIPIHYQLQKILDRYEGRFPKAPNEQVFNREVKNIAKRAGYNSFGGKEGA